MFCNKLIRLISRIAFCGDDRELGQMSDKILISPRDLSFNKNRSKSWMATFSRAR